MAQGLDILIHGIENGADPKEQVAALLMEHSDITNKINRLKEIRETLQLEQVEASKQYFSAGLTEGIKYIVSDIDLNNKKTKAEVEQNILEAYHLTTEILVELNFIDNIDYVFTYDDEAGNFYRAENLDIRDYIDLQKSADGYQLKLHSSIRQLIKDNKINEDAQAALNQHYNNFIEPYIKYERKNKTKWKISRGFASEAFERHYENHGHSIENYNDFKRNTIGNDLESEGRRWWMYKQSSGSAGFYTGPDTIYAQVKHWNATMINDINTVVNAMIAVINLFDGVYNVKTISSALKSAFIASPDKIRITTKIWDGLTKKVQNELKSIMYTEFVNNNKGVKKKDLVLKVFKEKQYSYIGPAIQKG